MQPLNQQEACPCHLVVPGVCSAAPTNPLSSSGSGEERLWLQTIFITQNLNSECSNWCHLDVLTAQAAAFNTDKQGVALPQRHRRLQCRERLSLGVGGSQVGFAQSHVCPKVALRVEWVNVLVQMHAGGNGRN